MALPISTGSGATLASNLLNGEHLQVISPVSLYPLPAGTNSIGFVSLPSINGSVAISNTPSVAQSGTWNVGVTGLVSLPSGTEIRSLATVLNFPATQAVSQSGTWNVGITGLVSLPSGTEVRSLATILNFPSNQNVSVTGLVSLPSGTEVRSLATILNFPATQAVSQSGTWNVGVTGLVSLPSGTEIRSLATVLNFPTNQNVTVTNLISLASGTFVSLNAGTNHIGSVSIFGTINSTPGMTTLFPGPNFIGLVTTVPGAVTPVNDNGGSLTVDWISGATVAVSNLPNVTLNTNTNYIGLVSVSGNVAVSSLPATPAGANFIGLATVVQGNQPALVASTAFIGLVSVQGNINAAQAGTWTVQPGNTANTTPWLTTQTNGLISLASGTEVRSLATILNFPSNQNVTVTNLISLASGTFVSLNSGSNFIGLATVVQGNQPALTAGSAYIGLASVNIGGTLPALTAGTAYVGLATVVPGYVPVTSTYTSLATVISASGNATLFTVPASTRWVLKDLIIGSQGQTQVGILSGTKTVIPPIALATMGGYLSNFGDSGFRGAALNDSFVIVNNSAVTISVTANVRFD